jgi:hypothetical protein
MTTTSLHPSRLAALSGAAYFLLSLAGHFASGHEPGFMAEAAAVQAYYVGHEGAVLAGHTLFLLSAVALLVFAAALGTAIRAGGTGDGTLASAVFAGALAAAALMFASGAIGMAGAIHVQEKGMVTAAEASSFWDLGQVLYGLATPMALVVTVLGCALASLRRGALPRWLGALSVPLGLALAVPPINHVAIDVFAFWALATSLLLAAREAPAADPDRMPATPAAG